MPPGQVNLTLEQLCIVGAYERSVASMRNEAQMLELIHKKGEAEHLLSACRHLEKRCKDFMVECGRSLIIPQAVVPSVQVP